MGRIFVLSYKNRVHHPPEFVRGIRDNFASLLRFFCGHSVSPHYR